MQSQKNLPYKLHRTPNNAQKIQHNLGVAFSYLERKYALSKGKWEKVIHPKSDYRWLWQAAHFSTKKPINKPAMNNLRILLAAVFHFVHPVEKDS